jgi:hypothetical protein
MIEKFKEHIRKQGDKMDRIVEIVAKANKARWKAKIGSKTWALDLAEQLKQCACDSCDEH